MLLAGLGAALAAGAARADPPREAEPVGLLLPCGARSPEAREARRLVELFDARVEVLAPAADPEPANRALTALLEHPCFAVTRDGDVASLGLTAEAAPALRAFWREGGRDWLLGHLGLTAGDLYPLMPTMRPVVSRETRRDHPLGGRLCPLDHGTCGAETLGWIRRAEAALQAAATPMPAHATPKSCAEEARALPAGERFQVWRNCVAWIAPRRSAMPLGRMAAPETGWLIVRGRRGHYSFCDEVRAYSLATGAAYVSQSCSRLALGDGGVVDGGRTDAARRPAARRGRMHAKNLRELAWFLLLVDEVKSGHRDGHQYFRVPAGIDPAVPAGGLGRIGGLGGGWSSDQTMLAWALVKGDRAVHSGTLTWPTDYNDFARAYAVELLKVAEGGFVEGCPDETPPLLRRLGDSRPRVSRIDGDPDELALLQGKLADAIGALARRRCSAP